MENLQKFRIISGGTLKWIALVTMFIDHAAASFVDVFIGNSPYRIFESVQEGYKVYNLLRGIGRCAFPIFCFLLVEGFYHTRDRLRYLIRLLIFAVLSIWPFQKVFFPSADVLHLDVLFTLALGFIAIWAIDERGYLWGGAATAACALAAFFLHTDYRHGGVILIVILYLLRQYPPASVILGQIWIAYYNGEERWAFTGFLLTLLYNGKRGRGPKYFFYFFYPLHLIFLYLLRKMTLGY